MEYGEDGTKDTGIRMGNVDKTQPDDDMVEC